MASSMQKRIYCFICGSVKENERKTALFGVPKDKLDIWRSAISNNQLKSSSKLCDAHFDDDVIIEGKVIGETFFPNEKYWKLQKGAIPTLFIGDFLL